MSRVERIGDATLYLGDCRDVLPTLGKVDACVTDPPYGIGYVRGTARTGLHKGATANKHAGVPVIGDADPFDPAELIRRFPNLLMWGSDHFYPRLPDHGRWLAWNKLGGLEAWDSFCDVEFAWHSLDGAARIFDWMWKGLVAKKSVVRDHPTQKPVALMAWCIDQTGGGETILDPYMGSGTTGVACAIMGRRFIGVEIDAGHFDTACRRIEEAHRQPRLFAEPAPKIEQPSLFGGETDAERLERRRAR